MPSGIRQKKVAHSIFYVAGEEVGNIEYAIELEERIQRKVEIFRYVVLYVCDSYSAHTYRLNCGGIN